VGSGAHSAPAWVGWLPANFIAGSALLVACSRVRAAASHSVLNEYLKNYGRPLSRLRQVKYRFGRRDAKPLSNNA